MSYEDEFPGNDPAYVLAIPQSDPLVAWVRNNCPPSFSEPELFRFMFQIGVTTIEQAKAQLKTDMEGVLRSVEFH